MSRLHAAKKLRGERTVGSGWVAALGSASVMSVFDVKSGCTSKNPYMRFYWMVEGSFHGCG